MVVGGHAGPDQRGREYGEIALVDKVTHAAYRGCKPRLESDDAHAIGLGAELGQRSGFRRVTEWRFAVDYFGRRQPCSTRS